ncbi:MAG: methionine adenosyltransferase [Oligoflexales bacterium]|nr:methionine adenosyltransferase [Oligoflexales bacterium]
MKQAESSYLFTSESVSAGHPDKIADQISDRILDAILEKDRDARVACETLVKTGLVVIAGEVTTNSRLDYAELARETIKDIGYTDPDIGFDYRSCGIILSVSEQSKDISMGVDAESEAGKEQGAGDQGMMFGYACDETPEFMPASIHYSHLILQNLSELRRGHVVPWLRPDAKSQVTVKYEKGKLHSIDTIVLSTQHSEYVTQAEIREFVVDECIRKCVPASLLKNTKFLVNPTGRFVVGGPLGDTGLTGRKIIVDTYGGHGAHGGGAFSGKDPSKVDRSAAYMARYITKNIVAAGLASRCLVQLAYAIGVAEPVSVYVNTYGTSTQSPETLSALVREVFKLKPREIIEDLDLLRPIYYKTASYGHFGRAGFPWENLDKVEQLRRAL